MSQPDFREWPKIPRLNRNITVTEKIDGTNACVIVTEDGRVFAQSRKRLIFPESDNFGFARWVQENTAELLELGPGYHFGEWWGLGIQRGYGLDHKRFSLFNVDKWGESRPACCHVVPVLLRWGRFSDGMIQSCVDGLRDLGSLAAEGFMHPEGVCVYHSAANKVFKVLLEGDEIPKSVAA